MTLFEICHNTEHVQYSKKIISHTHKKGNLKCHRCMHSSFFVNWTQRYANQIVRVPYNYDLQNSTVATL